MTAQTCTRKRAFTLIELLVVVAIIALLISILLPSMADAREQGRRTKCLANHRAITTAIFSYFADHNDNFVMPIQIRGGGWGICTWVWGGKTDDEAYWNKIYGGLFHIPANDRPLNKYILNNVPLEKDTDLPIYKCPSDRLSHQRLFAKDGDEADTFISSYNDVGTSYHYNFDMWTFTNLLRNFMQNQPGGGNPRNDTFQREFARIGATAIRQGRSESASTLGILWEEPMDWAVQCNDGSALDPGGVPGNGVQEMGYHKKFSRHTISFMDGHASHLYMDTRKRGGQGWNTIIPSWVIAPDVPRGLVYYHNVKSGKSIKNLDPWGSR